jgi:hypothetical protein
VAVDLGTVPPSGSIGRPAKLKSRPVHPFRCAAGRALCAALLYGIARPEPRLPRPSASGRGSPVCGYRTERRGVASTGATSPCPPLGTRRTPVPVRIRLADLHPSLWKLAEMGTDRVPFICAQTRSVEQGPSRRRSPDRDGSGNQMSSCHTAAPRRSSPTARSAYSRASVGSLGRAILRLPSVRSCRSGGRSEHHTTVVTQPDNSLATCSR